MATITRSFPNALDEIAAKVAQPHTLKVGFLAGKTYPDTGVPVPAVAAWNEFGVPVHNQPPRPFFRRMIAAQAPTWGKTAAALLKANNYDVDATLDIMGQEIQGRIKESINALVDPPLSPVTIKRKGFDKPLIEKSVMVNAVEYEVVKA